MQVNDLFVFWRHDIFPFVRWGKVSQLNDDGTVEPEDCKGLRVTPVALLPPQAAETIINQIQAVEGPYTIEKGTLETKYRNMIRKVAPFLV